jgi:hypothetical protein
MKKQTHELTTHNGGKIQLIRTEGRASTGPIDNPRCDDAGMCPECGEDSLWFYPEQSGPCHSGEFINHWDECYWCSECEAHFEEVKS